MELKGEMSGKNLQAWTENPGGGNRHRPATKTIDFIPAKNMELPEEE